MHPFENTQAHTHTHEDSKEPFGCKHFPGDDERLPADCNLSVALGE